jgi:aryl-alcohol dehydrogenase-like predicted oxidoreductase
MTTMQYRRLGASGLKVSELSFGSWVTYGNQMGSDRRARVHGRPRATPG